MAATGSCSSARRRVTSGGSGGSYGVAAVAVVWLVVLSGLTGEAGAWSLWPHWFWCFPDCVLGETCYSRVYSTCRRLHPQSVLNEAETCFLGALDWCNADHFFPDGWPLEIIVEDYNPEDNF